MLIAIIGITSIFPSSGVYLWDNMVILNKEGLSVCCKRSGGH